MITRYRRKLPDVLSVEEAARLLEAAPGLKYKVALGVAYGAGLRVSEVAHLKVDDVDSERMLLRVEQGIRRFLIHVLPRGFHRIRHYGLLAGSARQASLALARELLEVAAPPDPRDSDEPQDFRPPWGRMIVIEIFERWRQPWGPPHGSATSRETAPMTRHGMIQLQAAGAAPPAADTRAPMVTVVTDRIAASSLQGRLNRAEAQRSGLSASNPRFRAAVALSATSTTGLKSS